MKAYIMSDIHVDTHFTYANKPSLLKEDDPCEEVTFATMDWLWKFHDIPETEALIIPGDMSNDFLTFTREIQWLSKKYKEVFFTPGNHDMMVRGGTPSKSNLVFKTTEEKIAAMKAECEKYPNVHFLEGSMVNGIAGCMGMNDFKCEPHTLGGPTLTRWRRWFDAKHWKYMHNDPTAIWEHYDKTMTELCEKKPKIIVTHFVPYEVGVNWKYRSNPLNEMFYFRGEKYLDMLDDGTIWACGHIHDKKYIEYHNRNGNKITILCNPFGYPGEQTFQGDVLLYPKNDNEKIVRKQEVIDKEKYIVEI